jgi:hypothetical protein
MSIFATLRNAVRWAGFDLGRADGASAQAVVMIDPNTGDPVSPSNVTLTGPITVSNEVEIKNESGNPVPVSPGVGSVFPVSGSALAGTAPTTPPLSVSGIDDSGLKRHLHTDDLGNLYVAAQSLRAVQTATIANGASVSGTIDLQRTAIVGFVAPSAWTTAALNIEVSIDGTSWSSAFDAYGLAVGSMSALTAGAAYVVDMVSLLPFRYVRLRSGTSASPVNQAAQRDFKVITRALA